MSKQATDRTTVTPKKWKRLSPAKQAELTRLWEEYKAAAVALSRFYLGPRKWWYSTMLVVPINPGEGGNCSGMHFKIENPDRPEPVPAHV